MGESGLKIYTRTGDGGSSSLYNGERRSKADQVFAALGDLDELNSLIGVARAQPAASPKGNGAGGAAAGVMEQLTAVQSRLLDVGSCIATPEGASSEHKLARVRFDESHVADLEAWIDRLAVGLPPLTQFILPSGCPAGATLHLARTVCRRAERSATPLLQEGQVDAVVGHYLNRLSDYLFMAARAVNQDSGVGEVTYRKGH